MHMTHCVLGKGMGSTTFKELNCKRDGFTTAYLQLTFQVNFGQRFSTMFVFCILH